MPNPIWSIHYVIDVKEERLGFVLGRAIVSHEKELSCMKTMQPGMTGIVVAGITREPGLDCI